MGFQSVRTRTALVVFCICIVMCCGCIFGSRGFCSVPFLSFSRLAAVWEPFFDLIALLLCRSMMMMISPNVILVFSRACTILSDFYDKNNSNKTNADASAIFLSFDEQPKYTTTNESTQTKQIKPNQHKQCFENVGQRFHGNAPALAHVSRNIRK